MPEETPYFQHEAHAEVDFSDIKHVNEENRDTVDIFYIHSENPTGRSPTFM